MKALIRQRPANPSQRTGSRPRPACASVGSIQGALPGSPKHVSPYRRPEPGVRFSPHPALYQSFAQVTDLWQSLHKVVKESSWWSFLPLMW
jgi:hypothetical protein